MTDQHHAGGTETPNGRSAAGFASPAPTSTPARGSSPSSGEGLAASPDAASVEEHLTGKRTSATGTSTPKPTRATTGKGGGEVSASRSAAGEKPATGKRTAADPTAEPESEAAESEAPDTAATRGKPKAPKARGGRAGTTGRGRGAIATVSGDGSSGGAATAAAAAAGSGGDSPDADAGFPGRPKTPLLAGAAIAGALLIAVPLLIMATGHHDDDKSKKVALSSSADTVLDDDGAKSGAFVAESPSPKKSKSSSAKEQATAPPPPSTSPHSAPPHSAPPHSAPPHSASAPAKATKKVSAAADRKPAGNLPAVMTRVLIKNNTNGTCVDIPGYTSGPDAGPITQATCNSNTDDNQLWNLEKRYASAGPGGAPLFQIRNVMDAKCLDLPGYGGVEGATNVAEFPCNGTTQDNQLWWLDEQQDGKYWIRNFASENQCLDSYANNDANKNLIIWPCAPEKFNNHEWFFTRH